MFGNDFPKVWEASITYLDSVPVDDFMEHVGWGEAGFNYSKEFCPYVGGHIC